MWVLRDDAQRVANRRDEGVERALRSWPSFAVGTVKVELARKNAPCPKVVVSLASTEDPATLAFRCEGGPPPALAEGATPQQVWRDMLAHRRTLLRGDRIRMVWEGEGGRREDTYRVDGDALVVEHRVVADLLPHPIVWEVTYQRAEADPG